MDFKKNFIITMDEGIKKYIWAIIAVFGVLISVTTILSISNMNTLKTLKNGLDSQIEDPAAVEWQDSVIVHDIFRSEHTNLARCNIEWDNHDYIIMYEAREFEDGTWKGKMVSVIHDPDCPCLDKSDSIYEMLDMLTTDYD